MVSDFIDERPANPAVYILKRTTTSGRIPVLSRSLAVQSQRGLCPSAQGCPDFSGLPWVTSGNGNNANGVVAGVTGLQERNGRNRVAVGNGWGR
jgi:hypothetical protein